MVGNMNPSGIVLVLMSAICHAGWNILSKGAPRPLAFMYKALKYSALCYLPLFVFMQFYISYPLPYVLCFLLSGILTGGYFFCLGMAYIHGHLSVAYPLARALPILMIAVNGMALGEIPSLRGLTGMVLITIGCLLLPLKHWRGKDGFSLAHYFNRACLWALLSAIFTAGYSLIDKIGAGYAPDGSRIENIMGKINYVYLQNLISFFILAGVIRLFKIETDNSSYRRKAVFSGLTFLVSYSLIMLALQANPVAYVVSFRQISIIIGAVVSMVLIEKEFYKGRLAAVGIIFMGVILVGLG